MTLAKNVTSGERLVRIILGIVLIPLGFFFTGVWKPLLVVVGAVFLLTAFIGY